MNVPWPPEKVERLKQLAADGYSGGQIAMYIETSRSAVMGKLHRMGIAINGVEGKTLRLPPQPPARVILDALSGDILQQAKVAEDCLKGKRPEGGLMGVRFAGRYYSVQWRKTSLRVTPNEAAP